MLWHQVFKKVMIASYEEIQERNQNYSLRAFAKRLGVSPATVSELFKGNRSVSRQRALAMLARLGTPEALAAMKKMEKAQDESSPRAPLSKEAQAIIKKWEYTAIFALLASDRKPTSVKEIAGRLHLSEASVKEKLSLLERHGIIEVDEDDDFYKPTQDGFVAGDQVPSSPAVILESHQDSLRLASTVLSRTGPECRDFLALTFPADPQKLEEARKETRRYIDRMGKIMQSQENTSVFRLQIQLFDLTAESSKS